MPEHVLIVRIETDMHGHTDALEVRERVELTPMSVLKVGSELLVEMGQQSALDRLIQHTFKEGRL